MYRPEGIAFAIRARHALRYLGFAEYENFAKTMRAHAKRCRAPPVSRSYAGWSGPDCGDLQGPPGIYSECVLHVSEVYRPCSNYLAAWF